MKKVTVIVAPREPQHVALVPGQRLKLLDTPSNPGFKAWVKDDPGTWEYGRTKTDVEVAIRQTAERKGLEITDIEYQLTPEA